MTRRETDNTKALDAFIGKKAEIDAMLARLQALSDDHFNFDPEAVNWGSVGSISSVASDLRKITDVDLHAELSRVFHREVSHL